jgi:protein TonB
MIENGARSAAPDNVIAFAPRGGGKQAVPRVRAGERPAPPLPPTPASSRPMIFVAASVLLHFGALAFAMREPVPQASIGLETISVEIVVGANTPAGRQAKPSESEFDSAPSPEDNDPTKELETAQRVTEPQSKAEAAPPELTLQPNPEITQANAPPPTPAAPQHQAAEIKAATLPGPQVPAAQRPSDDPRDGVVPQPQEKQPPQQTAERRQDTKDRRRQAARASAPSVASSGVGRGRSDADTNYRGLVAAHLARFKQFPAEARSSGEQGTVNVTFTLDGNGQVRSVRLVRGSGVASLDQESVAMVHRASPFPAPPSGQPVSFTVPIGFHLQ